MTTTKTSKSGRRGPATGSTALGKGPQAARGGRKGRKPATPIRVGRERNWGPILLFGAVGVVAVLIIGWAFWQSIDARGGGTAWEERARAIEGIIDYRTNNPEVMSQDYRLHQSGPQQYDMSPPVAGAHNDVWQNCDGEVYPEPIPNEHAVHSLEHGAIWVTYNPDLLPADQVDSLTGIVQGRDKLFMSPYPGLESPVSLQAWGYQLMLDSPDDPRVTEFIRALRVNASLEGPTALCTGGTSATGSMPVA